MGYLFLCLFICSFEEIYSLLEFYPYTEDSVVIWDFDDTDA